MYQLKLKPSKKLIDLARRYVWWESPTWAFANPTVFLSNLMNLGCWEDILLARKLLGDEVLKQVLLEAPPGYFSFRSWNFWHLKLGFKKVPPLPKRKFV